MNDTLKLLHSHRTERAFNDTPLLDSELDAVIEAAYRAPNFYNGQQVSLVVVREPERLKRVAEISGNQVHVAKAGAFITVVVDFNKTAQGVKLAGSEQRIHESLEGFAVGAVDAGIAIASLIVAARSLGLGAVPIGGIRGNPQALIDLLELPHLTFPIAGVAIGHVTPTATQKPRLPIASFRHEERYDTGAVLDAIQAYEPILHDYWQSIGRKDGLSWTQASVRYSKIYFPETGPVAASQGLTVNA